MNKTTTVSEPLTDVSPDVSQDVIHVATDLNLMVDTIRTRHSTRAFQDVPLRPEDIDSIREYLNTSELLRGPLGRDFRIEFLQRGPLKDNAKIGTYGYVKDPQAYLVGMAPNDRYSLFEIAYVFQGLVLFLTSRGIGTCWLGGIFNQDDVRASTYVGEEEIVPAISPIGYPRSSQHLMGRLTNVVLKPHKRRPVEEIAYLSDFSTPFDDQSHLLYEALHLATLAPNAQNKQSWRVVVSSDYRTVHFYVKFKLKKQVHDNFRGYACPPEYLDIGIFYRHFDSFVRSKGVEGQLKVSNPGLQLLDSQMEYIISWHQTT